MTVDKRILTEEFEVDAAVGPVVSHSDGVVGSAAERPDPDVITLELHFLVLHQTCTNSVTCQKSNATKSKLAVYSKVA